MEKALLNLATALSTEPALGDATRLAARELIEAASRAIQDREDEGAFLDALAAQDQATRG